MNYRTHDERTGPYRRRKDSKHNDWTTHNDWTAQAPVICINTNTKRMTEYEKNDRIRKE
ncbi:hypothetical protein BD626DRAFT_478163 [Schizophyllum amplum]|uniref:Uncharacterized protein n=1 Tax=Schizophyllum amplum TaxID=97359 RepID=A0A550D0V3_9AGAR|nr:hypothetical protein BD626DRAFT_478163 [Auriculariopsis ampla]